MSRLLLRFSLLLAMAALVAACATKPAPGPAPRPSLPKPATSSLPPPVTPVPVPAEPVQPPVVMPHLPSPPSVAQPPRQLADGSRVPAVQALLNAAQQQLAEGNLVGASASLERAQRLAPQSSQVYLRLADVRLRQQRPAEAEQLLRKSLAFTPDAGQQAQVWRQLAAVRQKMGNAVGAQEALQRAMVLESGSVDD